MLECTLELDTCSGDCINCPIEDICDEVYWEWENREFDEDYSRREII